MTRRKIFDTAWEQDEWRPPPEETIDAWAERCLVLPRSVSSIPGPLDLSINPYLRRPLRCAAGAQVQEITLCTSTQVGKTLFLLVVALHTISEDPWNLLHVMPTEDDAEDLSVERYQEIIHASPHLRRLLDGTKHQLTRSAIRLNGCIATFRGAHSPAGLASRPVARLFLDEVDKYPEWSGREADPIKLARERTRTFWSRKIIDASTPTLERKYIWQRLEASTNERYLVPCPDCGHYQALVFDQIKWDRDCSIGAIQREGRAWYECAACGCRITDRHKPEMLRRGEWLTAEQRSREAPGKVDLEWIKDRQAKEPPDERHVGFHLWAGYSPWLTYGEIVGEFLRSKDASAALMNFRNSWLAEPWRETVHELGKREIRARCGTYLAGEVPEDAWFILAGVDVQAHGSQSYQYYVLRAYGAREESWLVDCGVTENWEGLLQVLLFSQYRRPSDDELIPVRQAFIDSGFRAAEVYEFCAQYGFYAIKSDVKIRENKKRTRWRLGGKSVPGLLLNGDFYKTRLHRMIQSGRWHLPADIQDAYIDQMVAEQLTHVTDKRTGRDLYRWQLTTPGAANHYLDAETYLSAAADWLRLANREDKPEVEQVEQKVVQVAEELFSKET